MIFFYSLVPLDSIYILYFIFKEIFKKDIFITSVTKVHGLDNHL